jgi:hypothetical protein
MQLPQTGGCQCGALRYVLEAEPATVYACHCHQCQHQSGSAFGISAIIDAAALRFTNGAPAKWHRTSPSGRAQTAFYCVDCGSRIMNQHDGAAVASLKPGTLDDTSWVQVVGHIFTDSAQPWTVPLRRGPSFPQGPDMSVLTDAWANRVPDQEEG